MKPVGTRASFKTSHFGQSLRWAQISILKILNVFFRLKYSPALTLTKLKRFEIDSPVWFLSGMYQSFFSFLYIMAPIMAPS
jgi:hypothetical protein